MTQNRQKKGRRLAAFLSSILALLLPLRGVPATPGDPVTVCVIDTGSSREDVLTLDLTAPEDDPSPDTAHGDGVCDILRTYAPLARIVMLRCFTSALDTPGDLLPTAVRQALALDADILLMPWATRSADPDLLSALEEASAAGVTLIAPVGNVGLLGLPTEVLYPASWPHVIAVGGVDPGLEGLPVSNVLYRRSAFMDVCALATGPEGNNGTSFAAARVAGILAAALTADPALSPKSLRDQLIQSARDLGPEGHDPLYGWGFVP